MYSKVPLQGPAIRKEYCVASNIIYRCKAIQIQLLVAGEVEVTRQAGIKIKMNIT